MINNNCLLCNDAKCTRACGVMDPARILRSLYFDNEEVVANNLDDDVACNYCDERCRDACPVKVNIRDIITGVRKSEKKYEIDYECLKSEFCGLPLEKILYMPVGSSWLFRRGQSPVPCRNICLEEYERSLIRRKTRSARHGKGRV